MYKRELGWVRARYMRLYEDGLGADFLRILILEKYGGNRYIAE
ncbi:conserved hypothetical protein [Clostridium perfringens C str. JGS1495]|nr:conserved hypothetical protein [Clostridium perfringens C str. JGS1495]